MKVSGVIVYCTNEDDILAEGGIVPVYHHLGYQLEGTPEDMNKLGLGTGGQMVIGSDSVAYVSKEKAAHLNSLGIIPINGLIAGTGELLQGKKCTDYPIILSKPISISADEYKFNESLINNEIANGNILKLIPYRDSYAIYSKDNLETNPEHNSMQLVKRIIKKDTVDSPGTVIGYDVALNQSNPDIILPMTIEHIVENAKVLKPFRFIVTNRNGKPTLKGCTDVTLKDLPDRLYKLPMAYKVPKNAAKALSSSTKSGVSISDLCQLMAKYSANFLRKTTPYTRDIMPVLPGQQGDQALYISGIEMAAPRIDYSYTTFNVNFTFKCMAFITTPLGINGMSSSERIPVYYNRSRSLFNSVNGALSTLNDVKIAVPHQNLQDLVQELAQNNINALPAKLSKNDIVDINFGTFGATDYEFLDIDFSKISVLNSAEQMEAANIDMFEVLQEKHYEDSMLSYLNYQYKALKSIVAPCVPATPHPFYNACSPLAHTYFSALNCNEATGEIQLSSKSSTGSTVPAVAYTIPGAPSLDTKTLKACLQIGKTIDDLITNKRRDAVQRELCVPLVADIKAHEAKLSGMSSVSDRFAYLESERSKQYDLQFQVKRKVWLYNQIATAGIFQNGFLLYNNSPQKVECDKSNSPISTIHVIRTSTPTDTNFIKYQVTIDTNKLRISPIVVNRATHVPSNKSTKKP